VNNYHEQYSKKITETTSERTYTVRTLRRSVDASREGLLPIKSDD